MDTRPKARKAFDIFLALAVPLLPALLGFFKIINADIGFHVATGRAISNLGRIPVTNVLSFAQGDQPWVLHQWLPAWLFFKVEMLAGTGALVYLKCVVIYATFLLLWLALTRRTRSRWIALLFFTLAAAASASRFYVRPFIFSMTALTLFLYLSARWEEEKRPLFLYLMIPACALFAGLHAGIIYTLLAFTALTVATGAAALARRRAGSQEVAADKLEARTVALSFGGALLTCVLVVSIESPWGLESLTLPFKFSSNTYFHQHLAEFRPLPLNLSVHPFTWALLIAAPVLCALHLWRRRRGLPDEQGRLRQMLFEVFLLLGFGYLVLKHQRIVYAFALVAAFAGVRWLDVLVRTIGNPRLVTALLATTAIATGGAAIATQFTHARFGAGVDDRFYPAGALDFVEKHDLPGEAYVSDAWGGHWLWRFYPERKVFYDNRLEAYSFDFYRTVYQAIRYGEEGWQEKLDEHGINLLLLKYSTPREREFQEWKPNIRDLAFASPQWRLVYWDDIGQMFVRRGSIGDACHECPDLIHFNPDTLQVRKGSDERGAAGGEVEWIWRNMPSGRACYVLSEMLIAQGRIGEAVEVLRDGLERYPESAYLLTLVRRLRSEKWRVRNE